MPRQHSFRLISATPFPGGQDAFMPAHPSASYQRLRDYIDERMRIHQPLMLLELLGRRSPAPAQDIARRILDNGCWAACSPVTASPATAMGSTA